MEVGRQLLKGVHIENLFHLLIFSMDFFFKVFIIGARLKQSDGSNSILFNFRKEVW